MKIYNYNLNMRIKKFMRKFFSLSIILFLSRYKNKKISKCYLFVLLNLILCKTKFLIYISMYLVYLIFLIEISNSRT